MAPRVKTSASKNMENDASSSTLVPDRGPESKSLDSANLQVQLENLRWANFEPDVMLFLASAHRCRMWHRECRRRDIEDKESLIDRMDLR
ncbi:uncharacterized protein A4U43_C06F15810 [Asparagus officinalis]|uniref:Uncharacterized protein n=1 Tax=Asparagus officinalis TaxID=4686 RepID=A0A5P1EQN3_ASPOF|nr:uncharacterized protein A4U43_C06F15810 [Asparagus officinalis]